jgi:D-sedoheptulose 7-phosphate isomerase
MSFNDSIDQHLALIENIRGMYPRLRYFCDDYLSKLLIFGNGGSAGDAQHFAAELVARFEKNRRALPAVALTTDTSAITAIGNDFGFDNIFERQVLALANPQDMVLGISTSGNSKNVMKGMIAASTLGCSVWGMCGSSGWMVDEFGVKVISVPSKNTARIQEAHIFIIHSICSMIEEFYAK